MYNFDLLDGEKVIEIFDDIWISQGNKEKNTTIALTNKRLLFMDYDKYDFRETLRIGRGIDYMRTKEVYYKINIADINSLIKEDTYIIHLNDKTSFEFDDDKLYKLLQELVG